MWSLMLSVLIGLFANQAAAQEKAPSGKPGVVVVEAASITATVEAIDYDKRTVALKGPKGTVVVLKVGPDVKNFKQIKVGDRVTTKYFESTAIYLRKPDEPPFAEGASAVQVAAPGEKPGVVAIDTMELKARVSKKPSRSKSIRTSKDSPRSKKAMKWSSGTPRRWRSTSMPPNSSCGICSVLRFLTKTDSFASECEQVGGSPKLVVEFHYALQR